MVIIDYPNFFQRAACKRINKPLNAYFHGENGAQPLSIEIPQIFRQTANPQHFLWMGRTKEEGQAKYWDSQISATLMNCWDDYLSMHTNYLHKIEYRYTYAYTHVCMCIFYLYMYIYIYISSYTSTNVTYIYICTYVYITYTQQSIYFHIAFFLRTGSDQQRCQWRLAILQENIGRRFVPRGGNGWGARVLKHCDRPGVELTMEQWV